MIDKSLVRMIDETFLAPGKSVVLYRENA